MSEPGKDRLAFAALLVDAALLALIELFFLPIRLGGTGQVPVPVTALLAMVTTPLLVTKAARYVRPRTAVAPLVVWLLTLLIFGLMGPGGDLVLVQDWRALLLLAGGALPAAIALGGVLAPSARATRR